MHDLVFETREAVPEALREGVKEVEGKFIVAVVTKNKLDEFRNNNINLSKERDGLKTFKDGIVGLIGTEDLNAFKVDFTDMRDTRQKVKDGKLVEEKGLEVAIAERTKEMKASFEAQLKDSGTQLLTAKQRGDGFELRYKNLRIDQEINTALMTGKTGLREDAQQVILKEARSVFRVTDEDKVIPYQGDAILYGGDGATPMTPAEWLKKLGDTMPFLLKESSGGGAGGGKKPGGGVDTSKMTPMQKMQHARAQQG